MLQLLNARGAPCIPKLQARVGMGAAGAFFYDRCVAIPANKRKPQRELFAGASLTTKVFFRKCQTRKSAWSRVYAHAMRCERSPAPMSPRRCPPPWSVGESDACPGGQIPVQFRWQSILRDCDRSVTVISGELSHSAGGGTSHEPRSTHR